jgi:hypothetical protein
MDDWGQRNRRLSIAGVPLSSKLTKSRDSYGTDRFGALNSAQDARRMAAASRLLRR